MAYRTKIRVWMPFRGAGVNMQFLRDAVSEGDRRVQIRYLPDSSEYQLTRTHLQTVVRALAREFGRVRVIMEFNATEQCDSRCQRAKPETVHDCVCSCLGRNHGGQGQGLGWREVGDTTLVRRAGTYRKTYEVTWEQLKRRRRRHPSHERSRR